MDNNNERFIAFKEYVSNAKKCLDLTSPQLDDISSGEEYRLLLQQSFHRIGELGEANNLILEKYLFPILATDYKLTEDDDDDAPLELSKTSADNLASELIFAYINLARGSSDENTRRNLGNRALSLLNKWFADGYNELRIGQLYFECFRDYGKALQYFDSYYSNKPNDYSKKCKAMMSRRR